MGFFVYYLIMCYIYKYDLIIVILFINNNIKLLFDIEKMFNVVVVFFKYDMNYIYFNNLII